MTTQDATDGHPDAARATRENGTSLAWSIHRRALLMVAALVVPVAILDRLCLGPSPGEWIAVDLRGLLIGAFVIYVVVHTAVTSALVALPWVQHETAERVRARVLSIHALTLIALGFAAVIAFVFTG